MQGLKYIALILLLFPLLAHAGGDRDVRQLFSQANHDYAEGRYAAAESIYRGMIDLGVNSASIHNNLGEALYRQDKIGEAIFQFMLAESLKPRDADIEYNLNYARGRITDNLVRPKPNLFLSPFVYSAGKLSARDAWCLLIVVSFVFWGLGSLYLFVRRDFIKWLLVMAALVHLFSGAVFVQKIFFTGPFGVVISAETPVYSAPGEGNVLLFRLHEGADFAMESFDGSGWVRIRIPDGKRGWVRADDIVVSNTR